MTASGRTARSTFGGLPSAFWWVWLGTLVGWSGASVLGPLVGGTLFTGFGGTPVWIGCLALAGAAGFAQVRIGGRIERSIAAAALVERQREAALVAA
ncbi:MAG TPA: hypothetical protein VGX23_17530 [Actinocrinis sp.]|nr:hypothetical protein [Actinocrinis sp.]